MIRNLKSNPGVKVTVVGAGVNILLAALKFFAGTLGKSAAMVADAFHSLSDLLTDIIVAFTHEIGRIPKDADHPYGHGRAETIGATVIGLTIIAVALGIIYDVWKIIESGLEQVPTWLAVTGALVSIVAKEILYHYTKAVGEKIRSPAIIANAWHHRSDAISSIAALIGIVAAMLGTPIMDPLAGAVVSLLIGKAGYKIFIQGMNDLMDTSLSEEIVREIENNISGTSGVLACHDLRTRRIGGKVLMDAHILVEKESSVSEGHNIAETVRRNLIKTYGYIQDILIHVDTEDDSAVETIYPTNREELKRLADPIIDSTKGILERTHLRVHFFKGRAILEVYVRADDSLSPGGSKIILRELKSRLEKIDHVHEVRVFLDINQD